MTYNFNKRLEQNLELDGVILNVIRRIAENISTDETFYVLNVEDVLMKVNNWRRKLPSITPYYAVKCNPHPTLLRILSALGVCFDCASMNEIKTVLSLGVHPSRIIFANPCKLISHLKYAAEQKVNTVTVDGEEEMHKIKQLHPTANVLLRIRSDAAACWTNLGMKFGCDSILEAPDLLRLARKLSLKIVGICFHVGSNCLEPTAYKRAISKTRSLFDLGHSLGFQMRILDIGGGFPGDKGSSIDEIVKNIREALIEHFPESNDIEIIAEPGRYFVESAFSIATYIHGKRIIRDENGELVNVLYLPDGIFASFSDSLFGSASFHPLPLSPCLQNSRMMPSFICGPTEHPLDVITEKINFPDCQIGDWIFFENMGAYKAATARYFSGFTLPEVYVVYNGFLLSPLDTFHPQEEYYVSRNGQLKTKKLILNVIHPTNNRRKTKYQL